VRQIGIILAAKNKRVGLLECKGALRTCTKVQVTFSPSLTTIGARNVTNPVAANVIL
jgi:hypothetical protein